MEGIDALVVCGGDGSLTGADVFRREWPELIKELKEQGTLFLSCCTYNYKYMFFFRPNFCSPGPSPLAFEDRRFSRIHR